MLKKAAVLITGLVMGISSINALDINNLDGAYYILKSRGEGDFSYVQDIKLSRKENPSRSLEQKVVYKVETDQRYKVSEFEFVEMDGDTYASLKNDSDSPIYLVTEQTEFAMTLENIDDSADIIKLVIDKDYSNYKYEEYYDSIAHMTDDAMISRLHDLIDNQKDLGYTGARKAFFTTIDNVDGYVECVYTGRKVKTNKIPSSNDMNCEHTWPQSLFGGSSKGNKKDDLNHLFPTDSKANSKRSSLPFNEVRNADWEQGGSKCGVASFPETVFEPRDEHKGDLARAMFYFAVRYNMAIDAHQENIFRKWHKEDPVSEKEIRRNAGIEEAQGNRNPFIDRPEFVDNIRDF